MTKYCRLVIWEADIETELEVQMVTLRRERKNWAGRAVRP